MHSKGLFQCRLRGEAAKGRSPIEGQAALDRRFSVVVGNDCGLESFVIFRIFERSSDGLGGKAVTYGIAARTFFAFLRCWSGTLERVTAVGFYLLEGAR